MLADLPRYPSRKALPGHTARLLPGRGRSSSQVQTRSPCLAASAPIRVLLKPIQGVQIPGRGSGHELDLDRVQPGADADQEVHFEAVVATPGGGVGTAAPGGEGLDRLADHPALEEGAAHGSGQGGVAVRLAGEVVVTRLEST